MKHQYIERESGAILTERLFGDRIVNFLYSDVRENAPAVFRLLTQKRVSTLLAMANFDLPLGGLLLGNKRFLRSCGVNLEECVMGIGEMKTPRQIFERKIRYWECRPMPRVDSAVVSPADSRVVVGSLNPHRLLFLKTKFFDYDELLGFKSPWCDRFKDGDFATFRLTPDKYHYNHTPVAGRIDDYYQVSGTYHSCNPGAIVELATPYSKNRRDVTIIQTDVPGGTNIGLVAMIEVVALMIGAVAQCYSESKYDDPRTVQAGMFLRKGMPKSLFRPGSSAVVLLFQNGRAQFAPDLLVNVLRCDAESRFSRGFQQPLVETDIRVRSLLANRVEGDQ